MQAKKDPECVKVVVRCRPMSKKETEDGRKRIVEMDGKTGEVWSACYDVRLMLLRCEDCPVVWRTYFGDHFPLMLCILPMVLCSTVESCLSLAADQCAEAVAKLCFFVRLQPSSYLQMFSCEDVMTFVMCMCIMSMQPLKIAPGSAQQRHVQAAYSLFV